MTTPLRVSDQCTYPKSSPVQKGLYSQPSCGDEPQGGKQAAEKRRQVAEKLCSVSGHDFSWAAESVPAPDFSPGERVFKRIRRVKASAPRSAAASNPRKRIISH
jgi:hypothetical protein